MVKSERTRRPSGAQQLSPAVSSARKCAPCPMEEQAGTPGSGAKGPVASSPHGVWLSEGVHIPKNVA